MESAKRWSTLVAYVGAILASALVAYAGIILAFVGLAYSSSGAGPTKYLPLVVMSIIVLPPLTLSIWGAVAWFRGKLMNRWLAGIAMLYGVAVAGLGIYGVVFDPGDAWLTAWLIPIGILIALPTKLHT